MHHGWHNAWIGICSTVCDFVYGVGVMETEMAELYEDKDCFLKRSDMALRDYFAGQALVGIVCTFSSTHGAKSEIMAGAAYQIADAMLEARK